MGNSAHPQVPLRGTAMNNLINRIKEYNNVIIAAESRAIELATKYGQPAMKYTEQLGICYLTSARFTKRGINTTYLSETALINRYVNTIVNAANTSAQGA